MKFTLRGRLNHFHREGFAEGRAQAEAKVKGKNRIQMTRLNLSKYERMAFDSGVIDGTYDFERYGNYG